MNRFTVQRYCAKNDVSGNPRRCIVVRDHDGDIVRVEDEGYVGRRAAARIALGPFSGADVIDLGDVDVAPGVYRRMLRIGREIAE